MVSEKDFNIPQKDSEELAKIAVELANATHLDIFGQTKKEIFKVGDLTGVMKDGIFYTGTVDGVGAKILIAQKLGSYYELGIDVFNSNINDLLRFGVEPKFALPTISLGSKKEEEFRQLMFGIRVASGESNVPIIGGETEVLRNIYADADTINVSLAIFGSQEWGKLIIRKEITSRDGLFIMPSSGIHNNGFSEITARMDQIDWNLVIDKRPLHDETFSYCLKKPTTSYLKYFQILLDDGIEVKTAEAVTGGGFTGRLGKILAKTRLSVDIDYGKFPKPVIFNYLQEKFGWSDNQMYNTFNMGLECFW